jgi:hypothetical protein
MTEVTLMADGESGWMEQEVTPRDAFDNGQQDAMRQLYDVPEEEHLECTPLWRDPITMEDILRIIDGTKRQDCGVYIPVDKGTAPGNVMIDGVRVAPAITSLEQRVDALERRLLDLQGELAELRASRLFHSPPVVTGEWTVQPGLPTPAVMQSPVTTTATFRYETPQPQARSEAAPAR